MTEMVVPQRSIKLLCVYSTGSEFYTYCTTWNYLPWAKRQFTQFVSPLETAAKSCSSSESIASSQSE